jgi:cell division protein FtsB
VLLILVIAGGIAGIVLWFYPEVARRDQMARSLLEDQEELASLQALRKQREREVYLLENDKEYIETIARDKLDMMKEGETIFRLDPAKATKPEQKSR